MNPSTLITTLITALFICFGATFNNIYQPQHWPISTVLLVLSFSSLFPFFLNLWFVPGGFAWRNYCHIQNPKKLRGPIGWPLLGTLPQMGARAHQKLAALASAYGATRLMAFSLGSTRVIIASHPETAKEILGGTAFSDRPIKESARLLMFERAIGFSPSGEYWLSLRRIAANHMFSPRRIAGLEGIRQAAVDEMIEGVMLNGAGGQGVLVRGILQKASLRNVVESVFGACIKEEELGFMVKEGYELITEFNWGDYFALGFLDFNGVKRRCHKLGVRVRDVVGEIIRERKKEGEIRTLLGRNDFLSVLLSLPKEDQLCEQDMVAVLWEMIFRGTDTVAILLEWTMARMVMHPDIQATARQEIDACVGTLRPVQDSDIPNLHYLQAVVKEVLRLHPPGPLLSWARLAIHDIQVDKTFIPAGTTAMVNMWAITHDPVIWKHPWAFEPERFMEEEVPIMGSDLRLAPFGSGRRVCPGKALGLTTVHLWLARLLQQFEWQPIGAVDLSECLKLSLEMKKPLLCRAITRR